MIMDRLLKGINTIIPIGSREWGGATIKSDFDYVLKARHIERIERDLEEYDDVEWNIYQPTRMYNTASVKFTDETGQVINFIFYPDKDIPAIITMSNYIKSFNKEAIADKDIRVALVEMFCDRHLKPKLEVELMVEGMEEVQPWEEGYNG